MSLDGSSGGYWIRGRFKTAETFKIEEALQDVGTQTALTTLRFEELVRTPTGVSQLTAQSWVEGDLDSADEIKQLGTISVQLTQGRTRKARRPGSSGGASSSLTLAKDGLSK